MKRSEIFFSAILLPIDFLMIILAALSAYYLREVPEIQAYLPRTFHLSFREFYRFMFVMAPLFVLFFALEGLYVMRTTRTFSGDVKKIIRATTLALVITIIAVFLQRDWFSSRFVIIVGWGLVILYVVVARYIMNYVQQHLVAKRGMGIHRVLLIGDNIKMTTVRRLLVRDKTLGYRVVGQIPDASISHVKRIKEEKGIDEIIIGDPTLPDDEQLKLFDFCQINNIIYKLLPTAFQTPRFSMYIFNGEPILEFHHTPLDGWGKILKRAFDIIAGVLLIVLFSPIMLLIALLIKLEDPSGPIIYKNERIKENGEKFFAYKFRYMLWKYCITKENPDMKEAIAYEKKLIAERNVRRDGVLYKIKNDPRKMGVGAFIERYSLDELPQFFNVLRGEMSLVGPRPHQEREVNRYAEYHRRLLTIKPGVTGMAQVSGRSDLSFEDEYRLEVFYIENWSPWLDIQICFKTLGALLQRRKNTTK